MLNNLKISRKLIAGFAAVIVLFVGVSVLIQVNLNTIAAASDAKDESKIVTDAGDDAFKEIIEQQNAVRAYVASQDPAFLETYKEHGEKYAAAVATFKANTKDAKQTERIARLDKEVAQWRKKSAEFQIELAGDPLMLPQAQALTSSSKLGPVRILAEEIIAAQDKIYEERTASHDAAVKSAILALWIGSLVAMLVAAVAGWILSKGIATPVAAMTATMNKLAAGNNDVEVPALGRLDEVGEMAKAVLVFKESAIEKIRLEGQTMEQRRATEAERQKNEAERLEAAKQQAEVVQSLAMGLDKLAAGDLDFTIQTVFAPEYEQLRADFNGAMGKLKETMGVIVANGQAIGSGAGEISQASDDLSRRTEQQAASLEETAAALDQITATVRKTAEGANHARAVVGQAKTSAERSGQVVRDAIAAMGEIEKSSTQISNIIGVIDEIAFQTNLLALNAGVEAARAGEAGRGFAVVASEVRALAQRSAEAAKEIKVLISASGQQVSAGVELVGGTGQALSEIATQVSEITGIVVEIAASAQEQATGLAQVNVAVNQMDQVTQQNAAMVEQSTAASHALAREAADLGRLMQQFNLGATIRPAVAQRKAPVADARAQQRMVARSYGATALKSAPGAQADGWEEF